MNKLLLPTAVALALTAPSSPARADTNGYSFCTAGLSLNFCGSVEVAASPNAAGGTDVTFKDGNLGALSSKDSVESSVLSQCSGSNTRIYTCAGAGLVTISFLTVLSGGRDAASAYVNAAADNGACVAGCETTTLPEPATLALLATGLLGLSGPILRWRRRRET